jgi:hypothetical protein
MDRARFTHLRELTRQAPKIKPLDFEGEVERLAIQEDA